MKNEPESADARELRCLRRAIDAVQDMGVYPEVVAEADGTNVGRTPWQDGWNTATQEMHRIICAEIANDDTGANAGAVIESPAQQDSHCCSFGAHRSILKNGQ